MKLGISLPQIGPQASPENLIRVARRAEELGYDSVWVLERLLWPINPKEPYPASADGSLPETYQIVFDPLETLAFVAAHTSRAQLGTRRARLRRHWRPSRVHLALGQGSRAGSHQRDRRHARPVKLRAWL